MQPRVYIYLEVQAIAEPLPCVVTANGWGYGTLIVERLEFCGGQMSISAGGI